MRPALTCKSAQPDAHRIPTMVDEPKYIERMYRVRNLKIFREKNPGIGYTGENQGVATTPFGGSG